MATKSQEILLKGNTTNASAVPSSLKVREIAINALDRSLFTNDGNNIVKLYTGTTKWFDVNGNANNALKADSVAWANITNKPSTFTPSAHTHTASEVSGLPTSLKNPFALTFGSKTYDGSAAKTITASDLGALTSITKSMVEGVLTGNITSHTHTFASLTSKPTTLSGYGVTDNVAYRSTWNNFIHNTNEFIFVAPAQEGMVYINYRTASGKKDGAITDYHFNNGAGLYANIRAAKYIVAGGTSVQFLKGDGSLDSNTYLNTNNYNSYAPTLTGTGASGTWGISISGNAASTTKLATPRSLWGKPFDGLADVSGAIIGCDYIKNNEDVGGYYIGSRAKGLGTGSEEGLLLWVYGQRKMSFYTNRINRMEISNNGNVLIGTTTDNGSRMMIHSSVSSSKRPSPGNLKGDIVSIGSPGYYGLHLWNEGSGDGFIQVGRSDGNETSYNLVLQPLGGNILIGTTTDNGYKLQVNGSERVYGNLIVDGEVSALVA